MEARARSAEFDGAEVSSEQVQADFNVVATNITVLGMSPMRSSCKSPRRLSGWCNWLLREMRRR